MQKSIKHLILREHDLGKALRNIHTEISSDSTYSFLEGQYEVIEKDYHLMRDQYTATYLSFVLRDGTCCHDEKKTFAHNGEDKVCRHFSAVGRCLRGARTLCPGCGNGISQHFRDTGDTRKKRLCPTSAIHVETVRRCVGVRTME